MRSERINQSKRTFTELIFSPFTFIAGAKALFAGIAIIIVSGVICYFSNCHFDGLIDIHLGNSSRSPAALYLVEGFVNWLTIALLIVLSGRIVAKSRYRPVDVFGTLALARAPYLLAAITSLIPGVNRYAQHFASTFTKVPLSITPEPYDLYLFILATVVIVLVTIWSIVLMYHAFSISCNAKGRGAIIYFTIMIIIGEIISKQVIITIWKNLFSTSFGLNGFA